MKSSLSKCVFVFGLPASGKTTVIKSLIASSKELIAYISSGDIARRLSDKVTMDYMAEGNLFPHEDKLREEIYNLIHKRRASGAEMIIIDGVPRHISQVKWLLENQLIGTELEGCLIQIIGENLALRVGQRMRDKQDEQDKFKKKIENQYKLISEMEGAIFKYGLPYFCLPNTNLEIAVKTLAKYIGVRK